MRLAPASPQLEPGCSVLLHNKVLSVVGILSDEADPLVSVMKVRAPALSRSRSRSRGVVVRVRLRATR